MISATFEKVYRMNSNAQSQLPCDRPMPISNRPIWLPEVPEFKYHGIPSNQYLRACVAVTASSDSANLGIAVLLFCFVLLGNLASQNTCGPSDLNIYNER